MNVNSQIEQSKSTQAQQNWAWLKSVTRELYTLDNTPLLGYTPPFPWDALTRELATRFGLQGLQITPGELCFREAHRLLEGMTLPHIIYHTSAPGIEGEVSFVISSTDLHSLMSKILSLDPGSIATLPKEFIDSFSYFLHIEALYAMNTVGFDKKLSLKPALEQELSDHAELCQDVWIQIDSERILSRIIINSPFRVSWQEYSFKAYSTKPSKEHLETIPVTLHIEAGKTTLSIRKWAQAKAGDLLLLDHAFYEPGSEQAKCLITVGGKPLFSASLEKGTLKIIEIPSHHEVYDTMVDKLTINEDNSLPHDELPPEEVEGDIFEEEDDEDLFEEEGASEEEDDDEFELQEGQHTEQHTEQHEPQEQLKEALPEEHAEQKQAEHVEHAADQKKHKAPSKQKVITAVAAPALKVGEVSLKDIPITITCELAQIETNVQKLLELAPGNMLDLSISSDSAVLLVVNGKIVGKGEIIKIGDTLGVRILEMGSIEE